MPVFVFDNAVRGMVPEIAITSSKSAPGEAVVAQVRGQYVCMLVNADGNLYAGHGEIIPRGFYAVVGVVLDRVPTLGNRTLRDSAE